MFNGLLVRHPKKVRYPGERPLVLSLGVLVIPAKAGIHVSADYSVRTMDSRFRGNDYFEKGLPNLTPLGESRDDGYENGPSCTI
jgi:hypothetical protein